ncbi:unnamed protein product [Linum trigynum]|uniref:Uncharacterized protein n=1 Tax=Linum trigynum TaxID=586398 RepID=A0AAV2FEN7_9ROSI
MPMRLISVCTSSNLKSFFTKVKQSVSMMRLLYPSWLANWTPNSAAKASAISTSKRHLTFFAAVDRNRP